MGNVNVVLPGGKVVTVTEEQAKLMQSDPVVHQESTAEAQARGTAALNAERSSGLGEGIKAGLEGAADTLSLGAYGKLSQSDPEYARDMAIRGQERPGARLAGSVGALVLPTGLLGKAAKTASELTPLGQAGNIARAIAPGVKTARAVEGAIVGVGGTIANTNVTGDPLTIESVVSGAGLGAIVNVGVGMIADKLTSAGTRAQASIVAKNQAIDAAKLFDEPPPSYEEFRMAHESQVSTATKAAKAYDATKAQYEKAYEAYTKDVPGIREDINKLSDLENEIRAQLLRKTKLPPEMEGASPIKANPGEGTRPLTDVDKSNLRQALNVVKDSRQNAMLNFSKGLQGDTEAFGRATDALAGSKMAATHLPEADLPTAPLRPDVYSQDRPIIPSTELPKTMEAFAKKTPESISKLANEMDDTTKTVFAKFRRDLGLSQTEATEATAADQGADVDAVHTKLNQALKTINNESEAVGKGFWATVRKIAKSASKLSIARGIDTALGGGFAGAAGRYAGYAGTGYALDGVEGALLGTQLMAAKVGSRSAVTDLIAKYAGGTGKAVALLGPVTASLANQWPSGVPDKEKDIRKQTLNRINDLMRVGTSINDISYSAVSPLLGGKDDLAYKIHSVFTNAMGVIINALPKDPGTALKAFISDWMPSEEDAYTMAHQFEALIDPHKSMERLLTGDGHPAAADILYATVPAHMEEAANQLANNAHMTQELTYEQCAALGSLFRIPLSGYQDPEITLQCQSMYLPKPTQSSPSQQPSNRSVGRPAAVQGPDANQSRVSQLQGR